MTTLNIGAFLPSMAAPGQALGDVRAAARHAEDVGLESVWVVDQLVAGTGNPFLDSTVALSAAAAATSRVRLGYGVVIVPLHHPVWLAKQVASLQYISGDRVLLGVGAGGDRHEQSWLAAGVPRRERGRRTDAALRALPGLIAGEPTSLDPQNGPVQLSPGATVPPILVGGMSDAALRRTVEFADGWLAMPMPPAALGQVIEQLARLAAERERPTPAVSAAIMTALSPDPTLPDEEAFVRRLTDPDGMFGMPAEQIPNVVVRGRPEALAEVLQGFADVGASRVVISIGAGDWFHQIELVAQARALIA